ncbi:MAG: hypothetical protein WC055_12560 [Melioribacteraceae bacterium]
MKLPLNGKVIVIDNEPNEAAPLLQVLAINKIPHVYYTGDVESLPREGDSYNDVRVIFLDINLTNDAVPKAIIAQLVSTLTRLLKPKIPYVAAIWSNKQEEHIPLIDTLFENHIPQFAPVSRTYLKKSDFFLYEGGNNYILDPDRPNIIAKLEERIDSCLLELDAIKLLIEWENLIHNSSTNTIFNISNIIDKDKYWNGNLKHVFYKLAYAHLGKTFGNQNNTNIMHAALTTLTSSFNDKVELGISNIKIIPEVNISNDGKSFHRLINNSEVKLVWERTNYQLMIDGVQKAQNKIFEGLKANNNASDIEIVDKLKSHYGFISPRLNTELLISKSPKVDFYPGNVYYKSVRGIKKRNLLKTYFPEIDKKDKEGKYSYLDISSFKFIEAECSPSCDYSQSKRLRLRFIPGVLYKNIDQKLLNKNIDSIYKEIPPFEHQGDIYCIVFDYRLFKSINLEDVSEISTYNFIFRLKGELLVDLQARISSHINRPGILTVS